jgi:hypothetical protein
MCHLSSPVQSAVDFPTIIAHSALFYVVLRWLTEPRTEKIRVNDTSAPVYDRPLWVGSGRYNRPAAGQERSLRPGPRYVKTRRYNMRIFAGSDKLSSYGFQPEVKIRWTASVERELILGAAIGGVFRPWMAPTLRLRSRKDPRQQSAPPKRLGRYSRSHCSLPYHCGGSQGRGDDGNCGSTLSLGMVAAIPLHDGHQHFCCTEWWRTYWPKPD